MAVYLIDYENGMLIPGKTREDALIQGLTSEYYSNYYNNESEGVKSCCS